MDFVPPPQSTAPAPVAQAPLQTPGAGPAQQMPAATAGLARAPMGVPVYTAPLAGAAVPGLAMQGGAQPQAAAVLNASKRKREDEPGAARTSAAVLRMQVLCTVHD